MANNTLNHENVNGQLANLVRAVSEKRFLVRLGNRDLDEKLELAMAVARLIDPRQWTVVRVHGLVGWGCKHGDPRLRTSNAYRLAYCTLHELLPDCRNWGCIGLIP